MQQLCASKNILPHNFVDLSRAAKRAVRFACTVADQDASVIRDAQSFTPSVKSPLLGASLATGGRWLVTRSRDEVQVWDLGGETAANIPQGPAAVFDLANGHQVDATKGQPEPLHSVVQLSQMCNGDILIHAPHVTAGSVDSQILIYDVASSQPSLRQLRSMLANDVPKGTGSFSFRNQLVAGEFETAMTVWDWDKDEWITFTEDNFFDQPACPLHTTVQLHLVPPYLLAVWGGEAKLFEIPKLRARRPKGKPAFVTIPSLWSVKLPDAPDANPLVGRILEDVCDASKPLHLSLVYANERMQYNELYIYRLPPATAGSKSSLPPVLLNQLNLPGAVVPPTLAAGVVHNIAWNIMLAGDGVFLIRDCSKAKAVARMCTLPAAVGKEAEVSMDAICGRIALLDKATESITILDMGRA
ncbi:hypothetical protein CALCODRAFT_133464 [Calocera cornea HHB12733]|uniref:WD40 repeat-like protein n=1 Tax=Calocera cornea HHB12733 TaxID=1353952 RepID=A0A165CW32_9BASI|nr:hypothetical protein CALCODRAFT_133464 [Calocera cornea HHB12733]